MTEKINENYDVTHNLLEGLQDKEKAKKVVSEVQNSIDELLKANREALGAAEEANKTSREYEEQVKTLLKSNEDLTTTLKNISSVFLGKKELWQGDKEMEGLADALATFVTSAGAIRTGVIKQARENNDGK